MPLKEFECTDGHLTEHYFKTQASVPEAIRCEGKDCRKKAKVVEVSRTFGKMLFGSAYAHATYSDRTDWLKKLDVQGFHQDEHTARKHGAPIAGVRDKLF